MRKPLFRGSFDSSELVVDNFAGGGGASTGIEAALGRPVDIAINHDAEAIAVHRANHPETRHYQENIWEVDPKEACGSRAVGLAWFSPDCKHFSRAKGTALRDQGIRGLAWVVIRWAREVGPRIIVLENVEEFQTWGPLIDGRPDPARVGETFRDWLAQLSALGYWIEFRSLVAADYGAPTTRRRLFLIARRDTGIAWPEPTHGKSRAEPWRPAADVIDWALPCPSIFDRTRPLAEATRRRIAEGIRRFVIEAAEPFIIPLRHEGWFGGQPVSHPVRTVTASNRGELGLVAPFLVRHGHYSTITGAGLREGCGAGTSRGQPLEEPLATVCATNDKHVVAALVTKHYGGPNGHFVVGHDMRETLGTVTAQDHHALTAAWLTKFYGTSIGSDLRAPLPTVTANARGGGHLAEVRAFLMKYYGAGGRAQNQALFDPIHTVTSKARFGLVTVHGEQYAIADIGMRMLQPHELFAAQGFPADYVIAPECNGKPLTKTAQIKLAGNSVCPQQAEAIVVANTRPQPIEWRRSKPLLDR